jgi:hypothetical protein
MEGQAISASFSDWVQKTVASRDQKMGLWSRHEKTGADREESDDNGKNKKGESGPSRQAQHKI